MKRKPRSAAPGQGRGAREKGERSGSFRLFSGARSWSGKPGPGAAVLGAVRSGSGKLCQLAFSPGNAQKKEARKWHESMPAPFSKQPKKSIIDNRFLPRPGVWHGMEGFETRST
ncbi:MAG: hypothetical protein JXR70_01425 [Spirochaetales bacterium]|nr:hypothetical protein [Spirochaetales bacterium]